MQTSIIMLRISPLIIFMKFVVMTFIVLGFAGSECAAVSKPHVIAFGKWISAKWPNATGQKQLDLKVRPLFVDTRLKEYTTGAPPELTDGLFVWRPPFRGTIPRPRRRPIPAPTPRAGNGSA